MRHALKYLVFKTRTFSRILLLLPAVVIYCREVRPGQRITTKMRELTRVLRVNTSHW